jgi:hypothetical protein
MARFTIWSQINQDMDNFISAILLKQQQNGLITNQSKGVWQRLDKMLRQIVTIGF